VGDARNRELVDEMGPTLTIDGFAIFGGVGIVSDAPDMDKTTELAPAPTPA